MLVITICRKTTQRRARVWKQHLQVGLRVSHCPLLWTLLWSKSSSHSDDCQLHLNSHYIDYQPVDYTSACQYRGRERTGTYVLVCFGLMGPGKCVAVNWGSWVCRWSPGARRRGWKGSFLVRCGMAQAPRCGGLTGWPGTRPCWAPWWRRCCHWTPGCPRCTACCPPPGRAGWPCAFLRGHCIMKENGINKWECYKIKKSNPEHCHCSFKIWAVALFIRMRPKTFDLTL